MISSPLQQPVKAHWHNMRITRVIKETPRAVTLELENCDPKIQFFYQAGQCLNIIVDIEGQSYCRSYSISSAPYEENLRITVQSINGGIVSGYINQHAKVGQIILCSQPAGDFVIQGINKPKLFFAAGSGITPIIAMLKSHLFNSKQPCYLIYFNRNNSETIFKNEISSLCSLYHSRLYVTYWYSSIQGRFDFDLERLSYMEQIRALAPDVYICGPDNWMRSLQKALAVYEFTRGHIYQENFTSVSVPGDSSTQAGLAEQFYRLSIDIGDQSYTLKVSSNESVLTALLRNEVPITSGCGMGKCGSCMAKVSSGQVETQKMDFLTLEEINEGYTLCCQARVKSDCNLVV
jgi:ferredoxin-NADP reductase